MMLADAKEKPTEKITCKNYEALKPGKTAGISKVCAKMISAD